MIVQLHSFFHLTTYIGDELIKLFILVLHPINTKTSAIK